MRGPRNSGETKGLMSIIVFIIGILGIATIGILTNALTVILTVFGCIFLIVGLIGFVVGIFAEDEDYVNFDFLFDKDKSVEPATEEGKDGN